MSHESGSNPQAEQILGLEHEILRALCASTEAAWGRRELLTALSAHNWHDPEHRVVFEALLRTRSRDPAALRSEIPATATRMGFPDVEWGEYFGGDTILELAEVKTRVHTLLSAPSEPPRKL
jgi:hypothetical protein